MPVHPKTVKSRRRFAAALVPRGLLVSVLYASRLVGAAETTALDAERLADGCTSCHGRDGHSLGSIPALAGVDRAKLIRQLSDYRAQRGDATVMKRLARGYTDAEIEALAGYFSSIGKR